MKSIRVHEHGSAEVLLHGDSTLPQPGSGELRIKIEAAGVNYIDVYHRTGSYAVNLPFIPGIEAAGIVDDLGPDVLDFKLGDRVAYAMQMGGYAEYSIVPAWKVVVLPEAVESKIGAAVMLQGMTAHFLCYSTYGLGPNDTALVHAGAGGVGLLLVQLAKKCGACVIATVSTDEKAELAKASGADDVILYTQDDFEKETMRLTDGVGVDVVYDSVGRTTFEKGLDCLKSRGHMVLYGQSSGAVPRIDVQILNDKGSLFLTRPSLNHYTRDRNAILRRSQDLFKWIVASELKVRIDQTFPLVNASDAHRYLEGRKSKGKVLLEP